MYNPNKLEDAKEPFKQIDKLKGNDVLTNQLGILYSQHNMFL